MSKTNHILNLKGGELYLTENKTEYYEVMNGSVLIYILPLVEEKSKRRYLIYEAMEGDTIPSMYLKVDENESWCFGLVALESARLQIGYAGVTDDLKFEFAKKAKIPLFSAEEYEEQMVEQYNINIIKEEGYIYATSLEQEATYERGLRIIYNLFNKNGKSKVIPESGNRLYDSIAFLCNEMNIEIASFDTIRASCGRRFGVSDIARISHFINREIILEEKWYKQDSGVILAFLEEDNNPIVCVPKGPNKYIAHDISKKTSSYMDEKFAQKLSAKAQMIYKPFPNKKLTIKDLFLFGMENIFTRDLVAFAGFALIGTLVGLLIPMLNEQLYDKFIPMGNKTGLFQLCFVILSCMIGNLTFTIVKNLATFRVTNKMKYAVQSATYDRLFNLPESFFRKYDSAELAKRAFGISSIYNLIMEVVATTLITAIFSLVYLLRMFKYSKKLSTIAIIMLLISVAIMLLIGIRQVKYEKKSLELDSKISSLIFQFLGGISKIRIAGVENRVLYEYLKPYTEMKDIMMKKERMTVMVETLIGILNVFFSIVFYYMMIKKNIELSVGAFMGFAAAFGSFSASMFQLVTAFLEVNRAIPTYDRIRPILETLPEYEENAVVPDKLTGEIEVNNLSFAYDETAGMILNDISIHISAGEYIGIVGSSGSGKSTLLKLLLGFEKSSNGKIYFDGKDIDSLDKRELRKKFGVVLQDGKLISSSIYENITITSPTVTSKRVKEVIKEVGLEEDIAQMPMGLHTVLSEDSGTISGGQQQRMLIARAIVAKPKILFFDEATSALDNVTQSMVCESLEALDATRIVIAHRLSTVVNCDRIFVLEQGSLIEQGSYKELMEQKGRFYELASRQMA